MANCCQQQPSINMIKINEECLQPAKPSTANKDRGMLQNMAQRKRTPMDFETKYKKGEDSIKATEETNLFLFLLFYPAPQLCASVFQCTVHIN